MDDTYTDTGDIAGTFGIFNWASEDYLERAALVYGKSALEPEHYLVRAVVYLPVIV